ncbi:hypothetical protein ACFX1Z_023006 [Malus domestica]
MKKKLDPRTTSCRFIGYSERSKGFKFYCPNSHSRIMETHNAKFLEHLNGDDDSPSHSISSNFEELSQEDGMMNDHQIPHDEEQSTNIADVEDNNIHDHIDGMAVASIQAPVRKSQRVRKAITLPDFVYLNEAEHNVGDADDPTSYHEAISSTRSKLWNEAMPEELQSMEKNRVWTLAPKPTGVHKLMGCKWVFKTKRDSEGNIDKHKMRLVAKGFTQKKGVDYNETFSAISTKDSMRIILALITHFDLELIQMDVKTTFLNGDLEEDIYLSQPPRFVERGKELMVCKLNKSIYGLKQALRQWNKKFDNVMEKSGFQENKLDECVYFKVCGTKLTKGMLAQNFDMKDLGEAQFVLGIEIIWDHANRSLGLSQRRYIDRVTKRFSMDKCSNGKLLLKKEKN